MEYKKALTSLIAKFTENKNDLLNRFIEINKKFSYLKTESEEFLSLRDSKLDVESQLFMIKKCINECIITLRKAELEEESNNNSW